MKLRRKTTLAVVLVGIAAAVIWVLVVRPGEARYEGKPARFWVRQLIEKSFAALPAGGLLVIHDMHINAQKTGPLPVAAYSALLMTITEGKCYSVAEIDGYLCEAGFQQAQFIPTAADRSVIIGRKA